MPFLKESTRKNPPKTAHRRAEKAQKYTIQAVRVQNYNKNHLLFVFVIKKVFRYIQYCFKIVKNKCVEKRKQFYDTLERNKAD